MEDRRGEEHIKLATEYGKTQLKTGHLVDSQGQRRGTGTELRTDEWGTLRAGKGLFVAADAQAKGRVWYDSDVYTEGEKDYGGGGGEYAVKSACDAIG